MEILLNFIYTIHVILETDIPLWGRKQLSVQVFLEELCIHELFVLDEVEQMKTVKSGTDKNCTWIAARQSPYMQSIHLVAESITGFLVHDCRTQYLLFCHVPDRFWVTVINC
jgi:hypothetical protein